MGFQLFEKYDGVLTSKIQILTVPDEQRFAPPRLL